MPVVSFTATVSGNVADFDTASYKQAVSTLTSMSVAAITVTTSVRRRALQRVSPGRNLQTSFSVITEITTASTSLADVVQSTVASESTASLSTKLGVTITAVTAPTVAVSVVYSSPPPSPDLGELNNTAASQQTGSDTGSDDSASSGGLVAAVVVAVVSVVILLVTAAMIYNRRKLAKQPSAAVGQPVPVQMMVSATSDAAETKEQAVEMAGDAAIEESKI